MRKPKRSGPAAESAHLLDTSTLLWALGSPERLSAAARDRVDGGDNIISVTSYWEVVVKTQKGLLTMADPPSWWRRATELTRARTLSIRPTHVSALWRLPLLHKDPFDRMLIAQAIAEGLPFVTNDPLITSYDVRTIW